jgi:hypothetical protein
MGLLERLSAIGFFLVLALVLPAQLSAQAPDSLCPPALCDSRQSRRQRVPALGELRRVGIVVEGLGPQGKELGLSEEELKEHLIILLRKKLPDVDIIDSSADYVRLKVALDIQKTIWGSNAGFVGSVSLAVDHSAGGNSTSTELWKKGFVMSGSLHEIIWNRIGEIVNRLTTLLAADWLNANP